MLTTTRLRQTILCLTAILLLTTQSLRAEWQRPVIHYTPMDYAAATQNWQMGQMGNGWIYAANNDGLLEFDGKEWHLYGVWNSTALRAILVDKDVVYAGMTDDFGIFRATGRGELKYESLSMSIPESEKPFGEIWSINKIGGQLYFQARHHIFCLEEDGSVTTVHSEARIYCCCAHDGALYAATADGVCVLSGTKLVVINGSDKLHGTEIRSLVEIDNDRLLIGTDFRGLYILKNNEVEAFRTDADAKLQKYQLYTIAYRNGQIAIGTVLNGIILINMKGEILRTVAHKNGLQNNTVLSLNYDNHGNIWAGLDQGIDCVVLSSPLSYLVDNETQYGAGYAAEVYKGDLYLGTNQGLYRIRNFDPVHPRRETAPMEFVEGSLGQVWSLKIVNGHLLCCHNRGLFEVENMHLRPICLEKGFWRIQRYDDQYWIAGTYHGFYRMDNAFQLCYIKGLHETAMQFIVNAEDESIQLRTQHGSLLAHLNSTLDSVCVEALPDTAEVEKRYSYGFVEKDPEGNTWYLDENAIYLRNSAGEEHMIADNELKIPGFGNLLCLGHGYAIMGGKFGFHFINTHHEHALRTTNIDKDLYIRSIHTISPYDSVVYGENYLQERKTTIELAPEDYTIKVDVAYTISEDDPSYAMYLEPLEREYGAWSKSADRTYYSLSDGRYTLHARVKAGDEIIERTLNIHVRAPWYKTALAIIVYILLFILLVVYIIFYFIRRSREARRRFEKEKAEELRESKMKILELENEKTRLELDAKSQELSNLLLNEINKNELANDILSDVRRITDDITHDHTQEAQQRLRQLQDKLARTSDSDVEWRRFEENFDLVNASFLKRLTRRYPWLSQNEKKLCVYIKMGLLTKEIAPLMGVTTRGVEMIRYRMRQKMNLDGQANLKEYFAQISEEAE